MYSKEETSLLTQQFWTTFGQYIAPVLSSEGEKINWVNYKTGEKDIRFMMIVDTRSAKIAIVLSHNDIALQKVYFDQFKQLEKKLYKITGGEWKWNLLMKDQYGKTISEIYITLDHVNIFNKANWPAIISFLKPRLVSLDLFWSEYKYAFEHLSC